MQESKTIKASKFVTLPPEIKQKLVGSGLVIPINDKFFPHFGNRNKLVLIYGSYGNGKSKFVAQDLIEKCRQDKYFKCFYGRKVFNEVRKSFFDELATEIEERGLTNEFSYSRADNSTMIITHKNGNKFVPFGAENAKNLKSIKDASHIVCEEFDQFTDKDFGFLFSRLRTKKADTQFYGIFNTEPLHKIHWIRQHFFDVEKLDIEPLRIFGTYKENYFLDIIEYEQKLRIIAGGREHIFQSIANGEFGATLTINPFFYSFDYSIHYKPNHDFTINDGYIDLSFDFNKQPTTMVVAQKQKSGLYVFDLLQADHNTFIGKSPIQAVCQLFKQKYPTILPYRLRITGDASGRAGSADKTVNVNFYTEIKQSLGVFESQVSPYVRDANLPHKLSGEIINEMFRSLPIYFVGNTEILVNEVQSAEADVNGTLNEWKKKAGGHSVDALRYLFTDLWINTKPSDWRNKLNILKNEYRAINN